MKSFVVKHIKYPAVALVLGLGAIYTIAYLLLGSERFAIFTIVMLFLFVFGLVLLAEKSRADLSKK